MDMSNKRKRIFNFYRAIVFIIFLITVVSLSERILRDKNSIRKNADFFSQNEDFEVLFFGSSHTEIFVNPMDLWKDFGIVSYNFGNPEESIEISYWLIKNAITVHRPKVVVLDVAMFNLCENNTNKDHLHYALDSFPVSDSKLEAINAALPSMNEKLEMIFPLGSYHTRWKELDISDFINTDYYVKGNMSYGYWHTIKVTPTKQYPLERESRENSKKDEEALYKIIDLCKQEEINLLFVVNPYCCQDYKQRSMHSVQNIAQKEGIDFINFIDEDFITDYTIDYYDDDHVNQSGMHKVTFGLGDYITNNYDIIDYREDANYSSWWNDYNEYKQLKLETLGQMADDICAFLALLHDQDYDISIYVGRNFQYAADNEVLFDLLQNIGRENLTLDNHGEKRSPEVNPLVTLKNCIGRDDYMFEVSRGQVVNEYSGELAEVAAREIYGDLTLLQDEMLISVTDADTEELKIVRKYSSGGENYEDLMYNINNISLKW